MSDFDRLVVKTGLSLGLMAEADRQATLAFAALHFEAARGHSERQVNDILRRFLDGGGAMLRTDHVELRRWLVDAGWLERDGFGRSYGLAPDAPSRATRLVGDASAERLDAHAGALRAALAAERAARRDRHAQARALN